MKTVKLMMMLGLGVIVSACSNVDTATRNVPFAASAPITGLAAAPDAPAMVSSMKIERINVVVPETLKVSEANRYYPSGDIVWREDPIGDRHAQVKTIFENAMQRGADRMTGTQPVLLDIKVERFHALTEKARYTVGGVHSIIFVMQIRDAATGDMIGEPRRVKADLDAFGGQRAVDAEARGQTQKVRISNHLAEVLRQEMTRTGGFENPRLGFMQAVNQL